MAVIVTLLVGTVPAFQITRRSHVSALERRGSSAGVTSIRWREGLVIAEVALACVLVVAGGLLLRSFQNVLDVELGFEPDQLAVWRLSTTRDFETPAEVDTYFKQITSEVAALPGVTSVGLVDAVPLGRNRTWSVSAPGMTYEEGASNFAIFPHLIDLDYLETMEIPLIAGRLFTASDNEERGHVVILNETAARVVYGGEDPLGRVITLAGEDAEIIGIVGDIRHVSLEAGAGAQAYFHIAQRPNFLSLDMAIRSSMAIESLAGGVASAIHSVEPGMPATEYETLTHVVDRSVSPRRFTLQVLVGFALVAVVLAGLGIYSVFSYSVTERMREIGIRMALGETGAGVLRRVLGRTVSLAAIGLVFGLIGSLTVSRWLGSMLYDVQPTDPRTLAIMAGVLLVVAVLAGLFPALRAARTRAASVLWTT